MSQPVDPHCPPPGFYWCPYGRDYKPVLTQAQVDRMWPNPPVPDEDSMNPDPNLMEGFTDNAKAYHERGELLDVPPKPKRFLPEKARNRHIACRDCKETGLPCICTFTKEEVEFAVQSVGATASDAVVLPEHYARFKIEPIHFICENGLNFFQGNILKYILRFDAKNGLEDLKKAQRYLAMFIRFVEKDPEWWRS